MYGLQAEAIGRNHRQDIGRSVTLHGPPPVLHTVAVENRLAADGGGIENQLRAAQCQTPGRLREPLVPADAHADFSIGGVPDPEARVAGGEIEFLLVVVVVGDMGLAVDAQELAAVQHRHSVIEDVAAALIEADGQHQGELLGDGQEVPHGVVLQRGLGVGVVFIPPLLAEIGPLKEFREQNHPGPLPCRPADQALGRGQIFRHRIRALHLNG